MWRPFRITNATSIERTDETWVCCWKVSVAMLGCELMWTVTAWQKTRRRTKCHCRTWQQCLARLCFGLPWRPPRCRRWRSSSPLGPAMLWCRRRYWWRTSTSARRECSSEFPDMLFTLFDYLWYISAASAAVFVKITLGICVVVISYGKRRRSCKYFAFYACVKIILLCMLLNEFGNYGWVSHCTPAVCGWSFSAVIYAWFA